MEHLSTLFYIISHAMPPHTAFPPLQQSLLFSTLTIIPFHFHPSQQFLFPSSLTFPSTLTTIPSPFLPSQCKLTISLLCVFSSSSVACCITCQRSANNITLFFTALQHQSFCRVSITCTPAGQCRFCNGQCDNLVVLCCYVVLCIMNKCVHVSLLITCVYVKHKG